MRELENLDWNEGEILETSRGWRILFESPVNQIFWDLWEEQKIAVKAAGFSCKPGAERQWIAQFWQEATDADVQNHKDAELAIAKHAAEVAAANEKISRRKSSHSRRTRESQTRTRGSARIS